MAKNTDPTQKLLQAILDFLAGHSTREQAAKAAGVSVGALTDAMSRFIEGGRAALGVWAAGGAAGQRPGPDAPAEPRKPHGDQPVK